MTYKELFQSFHSEFKFTLDAAASHQNHLLPKYYTKRDNGLKKSWRGETVWCHPPFGQKTRPWVRKAINELIENGVTSVLLLPLYDRKDKDDILRLNKFGYIIKKIVLAEKITDHPPQMELPNKLMVLIFKRGHEG